MARPQAFERELKIATAGLELPAINALLAKTAREALAQAQRSGEAPQHYVRRVNGRQGAPEESVQAPGPIVYTFSVLPEIAAYALTFAQTRSPKRSGRFRRSWFVMVNGLHVTAFDNIPPDAEVIITNDQPYARKIEIGKTESGRPFVIQVPPGIVEDTRQAVMRRFGNTITAQRRFISLGGAYKLRSGGRRRKDRGAGRALTYPALVINQRL